MLISVDLALYALRAQFSSNVWLPYIDLLSTGAYLACVLIWIGYLLAPEVEPASLTLVTHDEVEIWNTELQHLLRD